MFESQSGENQNAFSTENLKEWAGELGLDQAEFDTCLDSGKYAELVDTQTTTFQGIGVRSTPSFVINGKPIIGAQPYETFKQAIEEELAAR